MRKAIKGVAAVLIGLAALFIAAAVWAQRTSDTPAAVTVSKRRILVGGRPYIVKGVCYHPVPRGGKLRDFGSLDEDLRLMTEAGVNTVRVYVPIDDRAVLDRIYAAGIRVIMGFGYRQEERFDIVSGTYLDYIRTYRDHPAILMWELGNEYNYHPEWFGGDIATWYEALNRAAAAIHEIDLTRPVSTAHGELPDEQALSSCPNVDVWGMNVYRWDEPKKIFSEWKKISGKPMYLSETGADSYMSIAAKGYDQGINQQAQADATKEILEDVFRNLEICSGVTLFSFADGWWKAGNPDVHDPGGTAPNSGGVPYDGAANEEYWGIVEVDRTPKLAFTVVKEQYRAPLRR